MPLKKYYSALVFLCSSLTLSSQFTGGSDDGYADSRFTNSTNIYAGGHSAGHSTSTFVSLLNIYSGGGGNGYGLAAYTNETNIYAGGLKDGHATNARVLSFVWTGDIGDGWNVAGNWLNGVIPNITSEVIIPQGAPNFPKVNAGILYVGKDFGGGTFYCKSISILKEAEFTLRVNAFLKNYGSIRIAGDFLVLNTDPSAVSNETDAHVIILDGGLMHFQN